jgi:hypothetical protein
MKKLDWMVSALVLCAGAQAQAAEAISDYGAGIAGGYAYGGAGFAFTPLENMEVTSLGYSQNILTNFTDYSGAAQVSLWDSAGDLLSTALVKDTASTINQSYYQTVSPVTLEAGETYYIGGVIPANGLWESSASIGTFSVSPDITYLGVAYGTSLWQGLQPDTTGELTEGPDFQYTQTAVPEPSVLALGGLGLATLALSARKPRR